MADISKLIPFILHWEGRFVDDPVDSGGPTNKGVTLKTWRQAGYDKDHDGDIDIDDLKLITDADAMMLVLKPYFWDRWMADQIRNQSLANILVDWLWHSGVYGIKIPQTVLQVEADGVVGSKTLQALNTHPEPERLFNQLREKRIAYVKRLCEVKPGNLRFLKGWLNRINAFKFSVMMLIAIVFSGPCGCKPVSGLQSEVVTAHASGNTLRMDSVQTRKEQEEQSAADFSEEVTEMFFVNHPEPVFAGGMMQPELQVDRQAVCFAGYRKVKKTVQQNAKIVLKSESASNRKQESKQQVVKQLALKREVPVKKQSRFQEIIARTDRLLMLLFLAGFAVYIFLKFQPK